MYAKQENSGKILPRNEVCDQGSKLVKGVYPCICVQSHGCWKWQRLDRLSQQKFKEHQKVLSKQIFSTFDVKEQMNQLPIEIKCTELNKNLNLPDKRFLHGNWLPQVHTEKKNANEYQIYKHERENLWLYQVESGTWWIGTGANKTRRREFGFARSISQPRRYDVIIRGPPWEVAHWRIWATNGTDSVEKWYDATIDMLVLSKKNLLQKEMTEKITKLQNNFTNQEHTLRKKCAKYEKSLYLLFNNQTREKRLDLIKSNEFAALFKTENLCSKCLCKVSKMHKCVHFDCTGACQKCHDSWNHKYICVACGKDQHMECPVCMEKFLPEFMNIFECKHAVCWKCTCQGYKVNKPMTKCPCCRKTLK